MLALIMKWMTVAIATLAVFSALTSLYGLYELKIGACSADCERVREFQTYVYVGLVGAVGFSVSALAAYVIGRSLRSR